MLGGQLGDLPYRGLRIAPTYSKFLAQVTEPQVFVSASEVGPDLRAGRSKEADS